MGNTSRFREVLGVGPDATAAQVQRAYRKAVLKYHPDRCAGDRAEAERVFREIAEAYRGLLSEAVPAEKAPPRPQSMGIPPDELAREALRHGPDDPAAIPPCGWGPQDRRRLRSPALGANVVLVRILAASAVCLLWALGTRKPAGDITLDLGDKVTIERGPAGRLTLDLGNKVTMKLVLIPAGTFIMGSPMGQKGRFDDEGPQREVTISKPFYMGLYEVTKGRFAEFISDSGYRTDAEKEGWSYAWDGSCWGRADGASWKNPGFAQMDEHPAVCISHNDAMEFCRWLGNRTGRRVRLPTEAEWEYACRAGTTTAYPCGDNTDDGKGWANAADGSTATTDSVFPYWTVLDWDDGYVFTAPAGQFTPNKLGLYDVIGNVWEWCADWYDRRHYASAEVIDPKGPGSGASRVLRGGSWSSNLRCCRSATRNWNAPDDRYASVGFRVVVDFR